LHNVSESVGKTDRVREPKIEPAIVRIVVATA